MTFSKKKAAVGALIVAVMAPVCIGIATPSQAGTPGSAPLVDKEFEGALRKFISKRFFNRINATEEQREKLSKIMADTQEATGPSREEMRQCLVDLNAMMADTKNTDDQIKAKVKELRALHEKVQDQRLASVLEARKVLNPEQRQQIQTRINELLTGGLKPRRIGMLIRGGGADLLLNE